MDPEPPRWIEYMPVRSLPLAPRNAKRHADTIMEASISRFGFVDGPILDERTGRIVAGHGRIGDILWREDTGKPAPDGVVVNGDGQWTVPVQRGWHSESDHDAEGFLIGHNRVGERGGWDDTELADSLAALAEHDDALLAAIGVDEAELRRLLAAGEPRPPQPDKATDDDKDYGDGDPDPDHTQWHTVVIRDVDGTVRAAWLSHLDLFGGDEPAALAALLDVPSP